MRRRMLAAILSITVLGVLLFGVPLTLLVDRLVEDDATLRVERQAVLTARNVPGDFHTSGDPVELPAAVDGVTMALYDATGTLVSGDGPQRADAPVQRALANEIATTESHGAIVVAIPVTADETVVGAIRAGRSTSHSDGRTLRIDFVIGALGCAVIGIGAIVAYVVAGRLARPVRQLRDAAVKLGDGDFTITISPSRIPELDDAAAALEVTARRLDAILSRERSFGADASHQLRTPLAGLRAGIETELAFPREDRDQILHESLDDIGRLETTIDELLTISRTPAEQTSSCSLSSVQGELIDSWHGRFASEGRRLAIADATGVPRLRANGPLLRHALDILLDNALVHGRGEARLWHTVNAESVTISISDEGPGPAAIPAHGQTDPGTGAGIDPLHGHGLPLARRLAQSMPGRLSIVRTGPVARIDIVVGVVPEVDRSTANT
ncbi:MAG: HAMP domain-containing sensor histidine kinase [Ilumatobacteraceae bacterium]